MTQIVTLADREGPLGTITLDGGELRGSTYSLDLIASHELARAGSPQAAFEVLAAMDNGYVWALRARPPAGSMGAQLLRETETSSVGGQLLELAYDPAEPRDPRGRWTTWFHGVTGPDPKADVKAIRREGLKSHGPGYRVLATSQEEASRWAGPHGHVVEFRIPDSKRDEYLSASAAGDTSMLGPARMSGLHKDLPPEMIHQVHRVRPHITAAEARGDSRPVSYGEYQHLAGLGNSWIDKAKSNRAPITGLDQNWARIKSDAYAEARKSWGGATINPHTGVPLASDADLYAISVKPGHMHTVSVPETASEAEFSAAMDRAKELFRPVLERRSFHLGVFHDDEHHRIDMDPVAIVDSLELVEQVGSYTRAIGGAYHFKSGDGFWPPHVAEGADMAEEEDKIHFRGPGEWHSQAVELQEPEPDDDEPDED